MKDVARLIRQINRLRVTSQRREQDKRKLTDSRMRLAAVLKKSGQKV